MLRALGLKYKDFTRVVRDAGDDDERVLTLLEERVPEGVEVARRWSEELAAAQPAVLFLLISTTATTAVRFRRSGP